jgi:hypothetical protein
VKSPSSVDVIEARLLQAAADAIELRAGLDAMRRRRFAKPQDAAPLDRLAAMLFACAKAKPGTANFELEVAREVFLRRFGHVSLPPLQALPQASLVLVGRDCSNIAVSVATLAPLLKGQPIELVVADTGADPQTRLLAAQVRNLAVIHANGEAAASNLAAAVARAPLLALLEGAPSSINHWAAPGTAWIGAAGSRRLAQCGIRLPPAPFFQPQVLLAVARSGWCDAEGLDPALEDGGGLEIADLALKLDHLGFRLMSCATPDHAAAPPASTRHWDRMARFHAKWGNPRLAATHP